MATHSQQLRRGLPRVPGGDSWPPAGEVPEDVQALVSDVRTAAPVHGDAEHSSVAGQDSPVSAPEPAAEAAAPAGTDEHEALPVPVATEESAVSGASTVNLRRGLPRVPDGEPWPPAGEVAGRAASVRPAPDADPAVSDSPDAATPADTPTAESSADPAEVDPPVGSDVAVSVTSAPVRREVLGDSEVRLRRGLPRVSGGEPWPPEGFVPMLVGPEETVATASDVQEPAPASAEPSQMPESVPPVAEPAHPAAAEKPAAAVPGAEPTKVPSETQQTGASVEPTTAAKSAAVEKTKPEPIVIGSKTLGRWAKLVGLVVVGSILAAGVLVLAARGVTTLPGVPEFTERYTGIYEIPDVAEEGIPWWARWAHYLNFFFLLLIIRTGLLVRTQQKPDAFYTPKKGGKKVSIYLWLHTSVDILWLLNGLIFVVTLFATGHWRRIVPTSWEVFPNAVSALLQYMTLEWPTYESGWIYYNSLQELMYFAVIFIAAPLAVITGVRLSEWWPKNTERLNRLYPAPVARALHFPVMLFFVLFVIMHVVLVFATGARENLNHMFYGADEPSWMGFWFFAGGLVLAIAAVSAARPLVIAPVASLFGRVSNR